MKVSIWTLGSSYVTVNGICFDINRSVPRSIAYLGNKEPLKKYENCSHYIESKEFLGSQEKEIAD